MPVLAIKTKKGYYFTHDLDARAHQNSPLKDYLFDGVPPVPTCHKHWFFVEELPKRVSRMVSQPNANYRYELIASGMASDKVPMVLAVDEVVSNPEALIWEWEWIDEYCHLRSLYRLMHDEQPDAEEDVAVTFTVILELDEVIQFNGLSYPVQKTRYRSDGLKDLTEENVEYQLLDKILFPVIVLPSRPCRLSSKESYDIVREYVKQHVDLKVAEITSDYRFCFTVKKKVMLSDPYEHKREILNARGKSYKKRRWQGQWVKKRDVEVFEMTWSPENYKGYTPILGFRGENWEDLRVNIDAYLEELITLINQPLEDCPHCNGMGVVEIAALEED